MVTFVLIQTFSVYLFDYSRFVYITFSFHLFPEQIVQTLPISAGKKKKQQGCYNPLLNNNLIKFSSLTESAFQN